MNSPDPEILRQILRRRMPFGRYEGTPLSQLPVSYREWFARNGFPKGKLGLLLETLHVIKTNGLEDLLHEPARRSRWRAFHGAERTHDPAPGGDGASESKAVEVGIPGRRVPAGKRQTAVDEAGENPAGEAARRGGPGTEPEAETGRNETRGG